MIAIIDYGVGNLFSLKSSLKYIGQEAVVTADPAVIAESERIILPGVGAFGDAYDKLKNSGMADIVTEQAKSGKPLMGICLGMQLLFEKSFEYGEHDGLSLIKGSVVPIKGNVPDNYQVPHIGWNSLNFKGNANPLFKYIKEGDYVYFVHSYYGRDCAENIIAVTDYGAEITAAVNEGNVYGCQFHPEKSGETGMNILRAFCEL